MVAILPNEFNVITLQNTNKINKNKKVKYYTSILNGKQSIITFANDYTVKDCAYFISDYRNKYGYHPTLNNDKNHKYIFRHLMKKNQYNDLKDELVIIKESSEELINKCLITNLGLVLIHDFNYKNINSDKIDISFSAQEITFGDKTYIHSIEELNNLLN